MTDLALIGVLILILSASAVYITKAKKRGEKCIGCPYAKKCAERSCKSER